MLNQANGPMVTDENEIQQTHKILLALNHAREGETAELLKMLDDGLPVNLADSSKNSLLMLACYYGHAETAQMLIRRGADVEFRNIRGQTPLGGVAFKGYEDVAKVLLDSGADFHADSGAGATPMMFAMMFSRTKMIALFEQYGKSPRRS
jgi:uncharacterized protein